MSTATSLGPALWQDGPTYSGQTVRQMDVGASWMTSGTSSAISVNSGVINNPVQSLKVLAVSGMTIKVSAGFAIVANSSSNTAAAYKVGSMVSNNLVVDTADATNPRIDTVVIAVNENGNSTSNGYLQVITGTPAASPVAPTLPANSLALANLSVPANATSVPTGNITDVRVFTSRAGGVVPYTSMGSVGTGFNGNIGFDVTNNRFFHNNVSGVGQFSTLPWAPVTVQKTSNQTLTTSYVTVLSTTIVFDGSTDIKATFNLNGVFQPTNAGERLYNIGLFVAGVQIMSWAQATTLTSFSGFGYNGGTFVYSTSSATSDTPASGSHIVSIQANYSTAHGAGDAPVLLAGSTNPMTLRVEPVTL